MALKRPPEKQGVHRQPPEPYMRVPSSGCLLGPSASGKTTTTVALILGPYAKVFDSAWVFSLSANIDSAYQPLERHIKGLKDEGGMVAEWDIAKLNDIIDNQRKATEEEKLRNQKTPLTSCLLILDDWADHPE